MICARILDVEFQLPVVTVLRDEEDAEKHLSELADEIGPELRANVRLRIFETREETLDLFRLLWETRVIQ